MFTLVAKRILNYILLALLLPSRRRQIVVICTKNVCIMFRSYKQPLS